MVIVPFASHAAQNLARDKGTIWVNAGGEHRRIALAGPIAADGEVATHAGHFGIDEPRKLVRNFLLTGSGAMPSISPQTSHQLLHALGVGGMADLGEEASGFTG